MFSGRILIVTKSEPIQKKLEELVAAEGHQVFLANQVAAVEEILQQETDIQVLLLHMENEVDWTALLSKIPISYPHLQVILYAQVYDPAILQLGQQVGSVDYLLESFHPETIKQSVRRALEMAAIQQLIHAPGASLELLQGLKGISACEDERTLNRLVPRLLGHLLQASQVAVYLFKPEAGVATFIPSSAFGMDRRLHAQQATLLSDFFQRRWRRFNKVTALRKFGIDAMIPLRHREGLMGAVMLCRGDKAKRLNRREKQQATILATHIARTYYILRYYAAAKQRAFLDSLTGLYNQHYLNYYGAQELALARQDQRALSLLTVNVASFREVNEKYGHLTGAKLLQLVAETLKHAFRETDIVMRLDGDIFVALLHNANLDIAKQIEQRIHQLLLQARLDIDANTVVHPKVRSSVVSFPEDGSQLEGMLQSGLARLQ